jgi:hypothetical protein
MSRTAARPGPVFAAGFAGRAALSSMRRPPEGPAADFWPGRRSFCFKLVFRVFNSNEPVQIASRFTLAKRFPAVISLEN